MQAVVLLSQYGMGTPAAHAVDAPNELQLRLLKSWLELAVQDGPLPGSLCVYTEGVRLCADDSPLLAQLQALAAAGCEILVCTTCLNYYGLIDRLAVGTASCMSDIRARIDGAAKVWPL